ncbi:hypothetical protein PV08_12103 [Exophiala spinifera]|uniref:SET domain-containing protein n=1 Tax=Exophiala spinifera TaxID=91928 RepID=A0A0D1Z9K0_9EURO|nr:uncharacterized protein PV08_12103 [Exophiala spinifera]KIW09647.1 hypothetical protein PV08_12103 [Exophiala spinifera]
MDWRTVLAINDCLSTLVLSKTAYVNNLRRFLSAPAEADNELPRINTIRTYLRVLNRSGSSEATELFSRDETFRRLQMGLATEEQDQVNRQLQTYLAIFRWRCPFDILHTWQFDGVNADLAVRARQTFCPGQTIKGLEGRLVEAPEEAVEQQRQADMVSSIVESERFGQTFFMTSLARFVNHACDPNAKLVVRSRRYVDVVAIKEITLGEEVTVHYGSGYFGSDNQECLCRICKAPSRSSRPVPCSHCGWEGEDVECSSAPCSFCVRHFSIYGNPWPATT